jgi:hypothetical protein
LPQIAPINCIPASVPVASNKKKRKSLLKKEISSGGEDTKAIKKAKVVVPPNEAPLRSGRQPKKPKKFDE